MKHILSILVILLAHIVAQAQQKPIMVCNSAGTTCSQHFTLDAALTAASPGNYIYLPGGTFTLSLPIDKPIHLIGAGHDPDSTAVTGATMIGGNLIINGAAEGSTFEGFLLTGYITAGSNNSDTLRNCTFLKLLINGDYRALSINSQFFQCVFKGWVYCLNFNPSASNLPNEHNGDFQNCFFEKYLNYWCHSLISNCIFHVTNVHSFANCNYIIVKNSFFLGAFGSGDGGSANSNIMAYNNYLQSTPGGVNQFIVNESNEVYANCTDHFFTCPTGGYSYSANYKLKPGSNAIGAGTDNKDIGLYGGDMPWTDGSVPGNPHFYFKNMGSATNAAGHLPVNLKVRAQQD